MVGVTRPTFPISSTQNGAPQDVGEQTSEPKKEARPRTR
jgi:hypothetical protein